MQTVGATAVSGGRLKVRMTAETGANEFDDLDKAARSGVIAAVCCAEEGQAQPVRAEPVGVRRRRCPGSDRRCVMPPAPVVARATSVSRHGGRSQ